MSIATFAFLVIVPSIIALLCWGFADMLDESSGVDLGRTLVALDTYAAEVSTAVDSWTLANEDYDWFSPDLSTTSERVAHYFDVRG